MQVWMDKSAYFPLRFQQSLSYFQGIYGKKYAAGSYGQAIEQKLIF